MTETAVMTPDPQRMRALERANEIRLARAELKRRIADGEVTAAEVILDPPLAAAKWALGELLTSQRRWGGTRCRKFLSQFQITETKAIGALTERQRRLLAAQLDSCDSRELAACDSRELAACDSRELAACDSRELAACDPRELELV